MTMTDLSQVEELRVLERQRLNSIIEELRLTGARATVKPIKAEGDVDPISTVLGQQQRLAALLDPASGKPFYQSTLDGLPGPAFSAAVRLFQHVHSLTADGIPGPKTLSTLDEAWAASVTPSGVEEPAPSFGFDTATAPRLGRLLRAAKIVQGSVVPLGMDDIQLNAYLQGTTTEVSESAQVSEPVEGKFEEILGLQKELVFEILTLLGIPVSDDERKAIERRQTDDLQAFLAFCRGVDYEDRGLHDEAIAEYREAFARDSRFSMAAHATAALTINSGSFDEIESSEIGGIRDSQVDVPDRSARTGVQVGIIPGVEDLIGIETRTPDPLRTPNTGTIIIEGDLPGGGKQ